MIICEHCSEQIEPLTRTESTGGYYGDTYATDEWEETICPECGADIQGVYVESESLRRYFRRFGFPGEEIAKHVTIKWA